MTIINILSFSHSVLRYPSFFLPHLLAPLCNLCLCHLWHQPAHPHLCQTWQTKPRRTAWRSSIDSFKQLHLDSDLQRVCIYFPRCFPIKNGFAIMFEKTPWVSSVHKFGSLLHKILQLIFTRLKIQFFKNEMISRMIKGSIIYFLLREINLFSSKYWG